MTNPSDIQTPAASDDNAPIELDTILGAQRPGVTRHWLSMLILGAAAVGAATFFVRFVAGEDDPYYAATIEQADLTPLVSQRGVLHGTGEVTVSAALDGQMKWVSGKTDGQVKKGELLAVIDAGEIETSLSSAKAQIAAAQAALQAAQVSAQDSANRLARFESVWKRSNGRAPSLNEMEQARTNAATSQLAVSQAQSTLAAAQAALKTQQTRKSQTEIRAPISGTLIVRHAQAGQSIKAHQPLFTLAKAVDQLTIEVPLTGPQNALIQAGAHAVVRLDDLPDTPLSARLTKLRVSPPPQTTPPLAVFTLEKSDAKALPGMKATLEIELPVRHNVLLAPNAALSFEPTPTPNRKRDRVYLWEKGDAKRVYVTAGLSDGKRTEIFANGLKAGDEVIIGWRSATTTR